MLVERATRGPASSSCSRCSTASSSRSRTSTATSEAEKRAQGHRARVRGVVRRARTRRPRADRRRWASRSIPNEHEAVMQDDGDGEPHVGEVLRTGWKLKGRVLRPAMVKVVEVSPLAAQREWFEKDYYAVLGVPSSASEKELSRAYKKLAKEHHPDANPGNAASEERFKEVNAAYDVLGDAEKRKEYDEVRRMVASGVGPGGFGAARRRLRRGFGGGSGFQFDVDFGEPGGGFSDLLGNLLGTAAGAAVAAAPPGRSAARTSRPSCTCRSTTRCAASRARCGSAPTRRARRATARAPRPARRPRRVRSATAAARSRSTRARSRSRRCAPRAAAAARSIPTPCPTCHGRGRRDARARGEGARSRPASPTVSASA